MDAIYDIFYRTHDRFRVMSDAVAFDSTAAPFGQCRRGWVMGEGGFGLLIERGSAWRARGARCHGWILGIGAASAAVPPNAWLDDPAPLVRTMQLALTDAGLTAADVNVVYASANATRVLDHVEGTALAELFGGSDTVVTSVKGALGEFGASGSAACVAALLCGSAGGVPPIAGLDDIDPACAPLQLATAALPLPGPIALVNSFASGGALFSIVVRLAA
jgi:3-oxoacyl-[acyl-carrier-protein] synthase II